MDIVVFQEKKSAEAKIAGVRRYGKGIVLQKVVSIDAQLSDFIDDPEDYISDLWNADLVLNYLKHPDLVDHLIMLCREQGVVVISPGIGGSGFTPFTCCGLGRNSALGSYGEQFGIPEYRIELQGDIISAIEVLRGAPCGATWDGLHDYIGSTVDDVLVRLPRQVQYFCTADPSAFDPISGKSSVHYAGYVHIAALNKALSEAKKS